VKPLFFSPVDPANTTTGDVERGLGNAALVELERALHTPSILLAVRTIAEFF
jgi:hypothetical protein